MAQRLNGRAALLPGRRRQTLALGEEHPAALLVDLCDSELKSEEITPEIVNVQAAIEKIEKCSSASRDAKQEAFVALQKAVAHVDGCLLEKFADSAHCVLAFLLDVYVERSMYRSLVEATLQKLLTSRSWGSAAKMHKGKAIAIAKQMDLDKLGHKSSEKIAHFMTAFGVVLPDDVTEAKKDVIETGNQEVPDHNTRASRCKLGCCVAAIVCAFLGMACSHTYMECSSLQCPEHFVPKVGIGNLTFRCSDRSCSSTIDILNCCDALATCDSMVCPAHMQSKANASVVRCGGTMCSLHSDLDMCCERVGDPGMTALLEPLFCSFGACRLSVQGMPS